MQPSLGLSTYIWNNNLKSLGMLALFPVMLMGLIAAFFFFLGMSQQVQGQLPAEFFRVYGFALGDLPPTAFSFMKLGVSSAWGFVLGFSALWTVLGYFFQGALIRMATGARSLSRSEVPELYNMLENLSISCGMKMPKLCLIDSPQLNAFASGIDSGSYTVTVTRGLYETLSPKEMEAVLGHELTHIVNRDVRLLVLTGVFTGMLSFLADLAWRQMRYASFARRNDEEGKKMGPMLLVAGIVMLVGVLLSNLLSLALSRKREYMADAGSVRLTKDPEAMISALQKISGHAELDGVPASVRQMFIENPPSFFSLFNTHPSIERRIDVLSRLAGRQPPGKSFIPEAG